MKEEINSQKTENILSLPKCPIFSEVELKKNGHNNNVIEDSDFSSIRSKGEQAIKQEIEIKKQDEFKTQEKLKKYEEMENNNKVSSSEEIKIPKYDHSEIHKNNPQTKSLKEQEAYLLSKLEKFYSQEYDKDDFEKLSVKERIDQLRDYFTSEEDGNTNHFKNLPNELLNFFMSVKLEGDCGRSSKEKPDWLDIEKFKRGQKFAMDYFFGLFFSQLLSLFILFSFEDALKPLILTGISSTPYTSFKRYLSTGARVRNWFTSDPWTEGTTAYNDIQTVRKMHAAVRKRLLKTDQENIDAATKIKNPYCPSRDILLQDFQSTISAPTLGQCPQMFFGNSKIRPILHKGLNLADMAATQFSFVGLIILYPKYFGAHNATEDDLEAFCHAWRGIGYLLGMEDEMNFCRGSLKEVQERSKLFLEILAIPNFRELSPECEHMFRCIIEGMDYYFPGMTYECTILYLSEILNLQTPRLYSSLSYYTWIKHNIVRSFFLYMSKVPGLMKLMNKKLNDSFDEALKFSAEKHEDLKRMSEDTLKKVTY